MLANPPAFQPAPNASGGIAETDDLSILDQQGIAELVIRDTQKLLAQLPRFSRCDGDADVSHLLLLASRQGRQIILVKLH